MPNAEERRALIACAVIAGAVCLAPGERAAAAVAWALAIALAIHHHLASRRDHARGVPRPAEPRDIPRTQA